MVIIEDAECDFVNRAQSAAHRSKWLNGGTAILSLSGCVVDCNEALEEWFEIPRTDIRGKDFWELIGKIFPAFTAEFTRLREGGKSFEEVRLSRAEPVASAPEWFSLEVAGLPSGRVVRLGSVLPPLSELQEASWGEYLSNESATREMFVRLLRAEAQLDNWMRRWPGVIFTQRADFTLRFASPRIEEMTGVAASGWESDPKVFWKLVHEADAEPLRQRIKLSHLSKTSVSSTFRIRHAKTGRIIYLLEHRQAVVSMGGLLLSYEGIWLDVTRQTIAEKRLATAAWKDTLAVVTMGLSHDFSNVVAGIHALSESFLSQVEEDHRFREGLGLIKKSSLQASQLVRRILDLHQNKIGEKNYHELNEFITDLADLLRKIIPRRIVLKTELASQSLPLYIDVVEFRQVVINLAVNAVDAMPQSGRLVLRTAHVDKLPPLQNFKGTPPRVPAVCLTIQDSGSGIKARHLPNIFDPFFTTKPLNRGSGLGLYNARLFIEKHHGAISVESVEGAGTSFHLWLHEADFTETQGSEGGAARKLGERPNLLLAGSSAGETLDGTAEFLRTAGFQVVIASSQEQATECLQSGEYSFSGIMILAEPEDAVLLAFAAEARRQHPSMKFVLKVAGLDRDDLESSLVKEMDLVISPDLPQAALTEKMREIFEFRH